MKLRIKQSGFENYTGQVGVTFFENGLSVDDVLMIDALRISAVWQTEWEDGTTANVGQMILNNMDTPAFVGAPESERLKGAPGAQEPQVPVSVTPVTPAALYTREQLEDVADKSGINGLREIATPMGIKGASIAVLIDSILKAQPEPENEIPPAGDTPSDAKE